MEHGRNSLLKTQLKMLQRNVAFVHLYAFFKAESYFIRLADTRVEVQTEGGLKNIERQI